MLLPFYFRQSLKKEIRKAIEKRELTYDQLVVIYEHLSKKYTDNQNGFQRAVKCATAIFILLLILSLIKMPNHDLGATVFSTGITLLCLLGMLAFVKISIVNNPKRQFIKAVKKGYPEYAAEFDDKK